MKKRKKTTSSLMKKLQSLNELRQLLSEYKETDCGKILKNIRICLGYSQKEISDKLGIHATTYSRWERNLNEPLLTLEQASKLDNELKEIDLSISDIPCLTILVEAKEIKTISFNKEFATA